MNAGQADMHAHFSGGVLEKPVQQLEDAFLFLQRAEQLAHFLLGEMQVQDHQVAGAVHAHFRRHSDVEQALGKSRVSFWSTAS